MKVEHGARIAIKVWWGILKKKVYLEVVDVVGG